MNAAPILSPSPWVFARRLWCVVLGAAVVAASISGCRSAPPPVAPPAGTVPVVVSIQPQAFFVQHVGGTHVTVEVLVSPGGNPHTYEPTPRQIAALEAARIYFTIDMPFERPLVARIAAAFRDVRIVDTQAGIQRRAMTDHDEHATHAKQERRADELDPHTWLDPTLARRQAGTIAEALEQADPAHAADYRRNLQGLQAELDALDTELAEALASLKGRRFFVFHPAYGYFASRYGLEQVPVEMEGKEPSARQLADLIGQAKAAGAKVIFVQPQFSTRGARAVAEAIGGAVVPMDDLAGDYVSNLRRMAQAVRQALGAAATTSAPGGSGHD